MSELKPCPFCGGTPERKKVGDQKQFIVYVCSVCGKTPLKSGDARFLDRAAKKTWNRRAENDY